MEPVGGTFIVLATFCPVKSKVISAIANFPIFMVHVERRFEGVFMRPFGDPSAEIVRTSSQAIVF